MPLAVFLAFCILGCDFMIYVLFQWMYGEKRRKRPRKLPTRNRALTTQPVQSHSTTGPRLIRLPSPQHSPQRERKATTSGVRWNRTKSYSHKAL